MTVLIAVMGGMLTIAGLAAIFLLNGGSTGMQVMGGFWLLFGIAMIVIAIRLRKKKE